MKIGQNNMMRSVIKQLLFQSLLLFSFISKAQEILTYEEYISLVLAEHPVAQQAGLQSQFADAELLKARGALDPKLKMDFNQKDFDEKDYYQLLKSEIKLPTILGFDVKANFETNDGQFLNPQNSTTNSGLYSLGVEMDVLRNWGYNDRRAALDQAAVVRDMTENERIYILSQLILDASESYVAWWNAYEKQDIVEENLELAEIYLQNTKDAVSLGDKPAIDTLEAETILYDQRVVYQELQIERIKAKFKVNNYLWEEGQMAFLRADVNPSDPGVDVQNQNLDAGVFADHPEVLKKRLKADQLSITNRLAKQQLLPGLNLGYFPLLSTNENNILPADTQISNFKIGASFDMPLFRRKEKANLQKGELKLQETQFDVVNKQNELFVKWNIEQNNVENYTRQLRLVEQAQENYQALVDAELIRYNYGESSVFLVNKRLEKLLETQIKAQELRRKIYDAKLHQLYLQNELLE